MQRVVIAILRAYKLVISPLLPSACRFAPTCSEYMLEAVRTHGAGRGIWLGIKRLGRCHPFCEGGYDPVPGNRPQAGPVKL
jgi:putative membrane protein insertion efficiency factor